jgi:PPE-repeat protein
MYWGIPPEVNAFRLTMAGAGPTAHVGQVTAFETAAVTHTEQATQMAATAAATGASFVGAGGQAMLQCAAQQSAWMQTAGAFAQKSAATITEGTRQYGQAAASMIPFPTVVANRVREATLEATNIIGQNTPAIAEANVEYAEYWGQNSGSMMGYLAGITGLISSLGVPLPVMPGAANPAAAAAAGAAATGMSLGLQGAGAALSGATQAGTTMATAGGTAASVGGTVASAAGQAAAQAGQSGSPASPPGTGSPAAPGGQPADATQALQSVQGMMGPMMSAPSMAASSMGQLLSQAQQLPSSMGGQLSGLLSPALSAASGGFGGGGGTPGLGVSGLSGVGSPWSGLGGGTGGFAGGGSAVNAALTKPSAGAGMAGPVGVPSAWWNNTGSADKAPAGAGVRGAAGPTGVGPMGPGMYAMPGAAGAGSQRKNRDVADPDKNVLVDDGVGDGVPVYTDDGLVYVQGQEV